MYTQGVHLSHAKVVVIITKKVSEFSFTVFMSGEKDTHIFKESQLTHTFFLVGNIRSELISLAEKKSIF